eukprot:CAMPEP_0168612306 /NCGR_PEP_ID=MMETSP0449_2-20121227/2845_1 /TAXON_ID=1082188 /ORGANISM="Strombidium rassoulzadegani, Strain ras09" /LENGTH=73 /DNA_ID=CAMNT_0008652859 /DNA_START=219 /DNA_END=440 /DNA_ORIENTATION=+
MSFFGAVFMAAIGFLISIKYPYLGEWHAHSESMEEIAEMAKTSSGQCYTVAGVYGAFMVISMVAYCYHSRKRI